MKFNLKGVAKKTLPRLAGAVGGAVANKYVNQIPLPASAPAWAGAALKIAIGAFVPSMLKAKPGSAIEAAGIMLLGLGGQELLGAVGVPGLSGLDGTMPTLGKIMYNDGQPVLNGVPESEEEIKFA